jgi:hypothetical protein
MDRQEVTIESRSMSDRFISKKIHHVQFNSEQQLVSFKAGSHFYPVKKVLKQWQDYDYSPLAPKRDWRSRHHRNYYRVLTETGRCFELYCDRGTRLESPKSWILVREIMDRKE